MAQSIKVVPKKRGRGRPATGKDPHIGLRMPSGLIEQVDAWAKYQKTSRSEAIRRLVEQALAVQPKAKKGK
jgi:metal-responsive CopG/Arc/MetJ family transcriptional regulator